MEDIATKVEGSILTPDEFNQFTAEFKNLITSTGQTLSGDDLRQTVKAMSMYTSLGSFYTTSGSANSITLTPVLTMQAPTSYVTGLMIRFIPTVTNTDVVSINITGLSTVSLVDDAGNNLTAGRLIANAFHTAVFDGTNFKLMGVVDAAVVHKTGTETIVGDKTFSGSLSAPTQAVSDSSTNVATTAFIENKFKKVSVLPASPNADTWYALPEV